jgi:hypothetical protein
MIAVARVSTKIPTLAQKSPEERVKPIQFLLSRGYIRFMGHHGLFRHGLLVAFVAAIFGALSLSALELPNLPLVEIEATTSWPTELTSTPYRLLSNDSQHWYVYNRESGMLAMDQADVKSVRFWDDTQERPPTVSPGQDGRVNPD